MNSTLVVGEEKCSTHIQLKFSMAWEVSGNDYYYQLGAPWLESDSCEMQDCDQCEGMGVVYYCDETSETLTYSEFMELSEEEQEAYEEKECDSCDGEGWVYV